MTEQTKVRKASNEQKEYLVSYMEENLEFANDRFESSDGVYSKAATWQMLGAQLNEIEGAWKDVNQWRKYWRDQKLNTKEREALVKASFKKVKPLSRFEERIIVIITPAATSDLSAKLSQNQADALLQPKEEVAFPEKVDASEIDNTNTRVSEEIPVTLLEEAPSETGTTIVVEDMPPETATTTLRKRKIKLTRKRPDVSPFEKNLLETNEEKLSYMKKVYEVQKDALNWKMEYQRKLLDLRQRELALQEKLEPE